jgi:hypothetical protein
MLRNSSIFYRYQYINKAYYYQNLKPYVRSGERYIECEICNVEYKEKNEHLHQRKHKSSGEYIECAICNVEYKLKNEILHQRKHKPKQSIDTDLQPEIKSSI